MQSFREMTNMPVMNFMTADMNASEFFNQVTEADNKHWAMSAGCNVAHYNLVTGHAYTMLGAVQLSNGV